MHLKPKNYINYRLKDGDKVSLVNPARVDGYWFEPSMMFRGCWDSHFMLPGSAGTVVKARTPCVTQGKGEPHFFANVDILHNGTVSRIRVFHSELRRLGKRQLSGLEAQP